MQGSRPDGEQRVPRIDSYLRPESYLGDLGVDESLMSEEFWHTLREAFYRLGKRNVNENRE